MNFTALFPVRFDEAAAGTGDATAIDGPTPEADDVRCGDGDEHFKSLCLRAACGVRDGMMAITPHGQERKRNEKIFISSIF